MLKIIMAIFLINHGNLVIGKIKTFDVKDILKIEEIDEIVSSDNYFYRHNPKIDNRTWNYPDLKYTHFFLKPRTQALSFNDVIDKALTTSFPIAYNLQNLYQSKLDEKIAIGQLLPRIQLTLGDDLLISPKNVFAGLFGFLMPQQWIRLQSSHIRKEISEILLLKAALDQRLNIETAFIEIHRSMMEFEITSFYFSHLQLIYDKYFEGNPLLKLSVLSVLKNFGTLLSQVRNKTNGGLTGLANVMSMYKDESGRYAADKIKILPLDNFPTVVADVDSLGAYYGDRDLYVRTCAGQSLEIQAIRQLAKVAKLEIGVTSFGSVFSASNVATDARFGINFGFDTIPQILKSVSIQRVAQIDVQAQILLLLDATRRAHAGYLQSMSTYAEADEYLKASREAFYADLENVIDKHIPPNPLLILNLYKLLEAEVYYNQALHDSLRQKAYLHRWLLTQKDEVQKYIPDKATIEKTIVELPKKSQPYANKEEGGLKEVISSIKIPLDLQKFVSGNFIFKSVKISPLDANQIISSHLPEFLNSYGRSCDFFRELKNYIEKHKIFLMDYEKNVLDYLTARPFFKFFKKKPRFLNQLDEHSSQETTAIQLPKDS